MASLLSFLPARFPIFRISPRTETLSASSVWQCISASWMDPLLREVFIHIKRRAFIHKYSKQCLGILFLDSSSRYLYEFRVLWYQLHTHGPLLCLWNIFHEMQVNGFQWKIVLNCFADNCKCLQVKNTVLLGNFTVLLTHLSGKPSWFTRAKVLYSTATGIWLSKLITLSWNRYDISFNPRQKSYAWSALAALSDGRPGL